MINNYMTLFRTLSFTTTIVVSLFLYSCGNTTEKKEIKVVSRKISTNLKSNKLQEIDTVNSTTKTIINDSLVPTKIQKKQTDKEIKKSVTSTKISEHTNIVKTPTPKKKDYNAFVHFKKMLKETKTGETLTQKELSEYHQIPRDAIKLIKSITKITDNEIAIKWHSTWMVEKVSDATFTDATMKIYFNQDKMYTSGKAIGINYNRKTYTDLIIIGNSAYIPSVKGYHWKIGK